MSPEEAFSLINNYDVREPVRRYAPQWSTVAVDSSGIILDVIRHTSEWSAPILGFLFTLLASVITGVFVHERLQLSFAYTALTMLTVVSSWPVVFWSGGGLETSPVSRLSCHSDNLDDSQTASHWKPGSAVCAGSLLSRSHPARRSHVRNGRHVLYNLETPQRQGRPCFHRNVLAILCRIPWRRLVSPLVVLRRASAQHLLRQSGQRVDFDSTWTYLPLGICHKGNGWTLPSARTSRRNPGCPIHLPNVL